MEIRSLLLTMNGSKDKWIIDETFIEVAVIEHIGKKDIEDAG